MDINFREIDFCVSLFIAVVRGVMCVIVFNVYKIIEDVLTESVQFALNCNLKFSKAQQMFCVELFLRLPDT